MRTAKSPGMNMCGAVPTASGRAISNIIRGDTMTVLENLYNGNIEPTDSENLKNNGRYKEWLWLVGRLHEELAATLNEEHKEPLEKYLTATNELSIVINEETFKTGYRLATQIMIECM